MLTPLQRKLCLRTLSPNVFYLLVLDALETKRLLSVVRMADGEAALLKQCRSGNPNDLVSPPPGHDSSWLERYGVAGLTKAALEHRINVAATQCGYFAPSVTGLIQSDFDMYEFFPLRDQYVDNFFVDAWSVEQKTALFKQAGHVLFIHGNPHTADSMQLRVQANLRVKVSYLKLTNWREANQVVDAAREINAPLTLFSAGPASKWIGPAIVNGGRVAKVALDLGHGADHWTMNHLPIDRAAAEKFHAEWSAKR